MYIRLEEWENVMVQIPATFESAVFVVSWQHYLFFHFLAHERSRVVHPNVYYIHGHEPRSREAGYDSSS